MKASISMANMMSRMVTLGFDLHANAIRTGFDTAASFIPQTDETDNGWIKELFSICSDTAVNLDKFVEEKITSGINQYEQERQGELDFTRLFTETPPTQTWNVAFDEKDVLLDLPGMRLIDISADTDHVIDNYTVVFAPRAGHHSNIAERTAIHLRDQGMTRMAIVEQKCAADIPMYVDGKRHYENFEGHVSQYKQMLTHVKDLTGAPPHLVAVCQPGPLLISTVILYPELACTFGSAGSPMHTEGEKGFLTDFSRMMGESYIDKLMQAFPARVGAGEIGEGREIYDGRLQVLGFYILGIDQHTRNLTRLLADFKEGRTESAGRQKQFYEWYNHALHFPAGYIRDTFKEVFVRNGLIHGTLKLHGRKVSIRNYPDSVPIWALGGTNDAIAPPQQAIGHVALIENLPESEKMTILADAGHMGLFRSHRVLNQFYGKIIDFMKSHSDYRFSQDHAPASVA